MDADSRVSPVSFLNANPNLLVTVLNSRCTMFSAYRRFWYSFMSTTCVRIIVQGMEWATCSREMLGLQPGLFHEP